MMNLEYFRDVHPNWEVIESVDEQEADALLDLMVLTVYTDDEISDEELAALKEEWQHLPFVGETHSDAELAERMEETHALLNRVVQYPEMFRGFMQGIADAITDEEMRMAAYRLVCIISSIDGFDESELELCEAVGTSFELDTDTMDNILRAVWESHGEGVDLEAGNEHHVPPIFGTRYWEKRSMNPYGNPFATKRSS